MFSCPEAIEKLLKGLLVAHGRNFGKTHDLVKLLTDVADLAPELLSFEELLEEISEYGVASRYPDAFCDPTLDEACQAFEVATKIEEIVLGKI